MYNMYFVSNENLFELKYKHKTHSSLGARIVASVANYVERILRLKKRDLEAAEQVDVPA